MLVQKAATLLVVFTSANQTMTGKPTGWYLPEIAIPYYCLERHVKMDFASPKGANPPVDPGSVTNWVHDADSVRFMQDPKVKAKFASAKKLSQVDVDNYDAIFYVGGLGPTMDLPNSAANTRVATDFWQKGKLVTGICHGPAGLVNVKDRQGKSIFAGRKCNSATNAEDADAAQLQEVPFLLETKLIQLGCKYQKADIWEEKVVKDGRLITGQNPASGKLFGDTVLKALTGKTCM